MLLSIRRGMISSQCKKYPLSERKVISRIKGGLGNQLFCYAAARRLAFVNDAELVIDDVSGFARDTLYRRQYMLDRFNISARKATARERLEPLERYRRFIMKSWSRRRPFSERRYVEQEQVEFDERLLHLRFEGTIYLDGLWQGFGYFKYFEDKIREDLRITSSSDTTDLGLADAIRGTESVGLHVRWFDAPGSQETHNTSAEYYRRAIALMDSRLESPHYFLFSDDPAAALLKVSVPKGRVTVASNCQHQHSAQVDLSLLSQCKHFITANSTFSLWAAWLGRSDVKIIMTPDIKLSGKTAWGFSGLIPDDWMRI